MQLGLSATGSIEAVSRTSSQKLDQSRASKAAREFEGILLSSMLSQLAEAFEVPGAEGQDSASESIRGLGLQQLGQVWSEAGGIGLAGMILRQIKPETEPHGSDGVSSSVVAPKDRRQENARAD